MEEIDGLLDGAGENTNTGETKAISLLAEFCDSFWGGGGIEEGMIDVFGEIDIGGELNMGERVGQDGAYPM